MCVVEAKPEKGNKAIIKILREEINRDKNDLKCWLGTCGLVQKFFLFF